MNERVDIPWKKILTSVPVWANIIAHTAGNFGTYVLISYMPTYLEEQLHYNIKSAAIICELTNSSQINLEDRASFYSSCDSSCGESRDNDACGNLFRLSRRTRENENHHRPKNHVYDRPLRSWDLDCSCWPRGL